MSHHGQICFISLIALILDRIPSVIELEASSLKFQVMGNLAHLVTPTLSLNCRIFEVSILEDKGRVL